MIGDTVGDPMKDTSGPSLNILMKLMAIISLVFADFFFAIKYVRSFVHCMMMMIMIVICDDVHMWW